MWKKGINIPSCGILSFPGGSDSEESACNSGDLCSIPGSGRSPGEAVELGGASRNSTGFGAMEEGLMTS